MNRISAFCVSAFLVSLLLSGCGGYTPDYDLSPRAGFSLQNAPLGDTRIPALVLSQDPAPEGKRPAVILLHGGGVVDAVATPGMPYKEEWFRPGYAEVPYRLAGKGMLVVVLDAAWAESRVPATEHEAVRANPLKAVLSYYLAAVQDIPRVIDHLATREDVDAARIGLAGKSGGAITSLMAACEEPRLAAVVSWKGGAGFGEMTKLRGEGEMMEELSEQFPEFRKTLDAADPINNAAKIPPKALALINNRTDPLIPRESAEVLHEKLVPLYAEHPENLMLMLVETKKPTHDDQMEAFEAGCQWLEDHLLPQASP